MLYFELAWRNLFRNTRRTFLTCLLISSGLAVLVFADGAIRGMEKLMIGSLTKTLQGEGHINSTASMAGLYAGASLGAYNVAKHGVVALMASLERDLRWRESKVRASVLCPGPINTKIVDSERNRDPDDAANHVDSEQGQKFWEFLTRTLANGMDPAEVGPMVLDAVINDKFWILTHPEMGEIAINQARAMLDDQHLTR